MSHNFKFFNSCHKIGFLLNVAKFCLFLFFGPDNPVLNNFNAANSFSSDKVSNTFPTTFSLTKNEKLFNFIFNYIYCTFYVYDLSIS